LGIKKLKKQSIKKIRTMKVFGIILEIFAAMNLLVAIIASANNANANVVMSKVSSAFLLAAIGGLLHYFGNKRNAAKNDTSTPTAHNNQKIQVNTTNTGDSDVLSALLLMKAVEKLTGVNLSTSNDKDREELLQSMTRWSKNLGCDILNIKHVFMEKTLETFDSDELGVVISQLKNEKIAEEAKHFGIAEKNTCTFYMIKWLSEMDKMKSMKVHPNHAVKEDNDLPF
jgi:hypothetical protein